MTEIKQDKKEIAKNRAEKLVDLRDVPQIVIFDELRELNTLLEGVISSVNASKTTEITVSNPEDINLDLSPLESNFEALKESTDKVLKAIEGKKDMDMSGVEKLLKVISEKEVGVDMRELTSISSILTNVLEAVQTTASFSSKKGEELQPDLKEIQKILKVMNDNIVDTETPEDFDYDRFEEILKKHLRITVSSSGGGGSATVTKQDETISELKKLVGFEIPPYDEIDLTYVATGNGTGEVETAIFSLTGTPHTTLTITYNSDDEVINVIKT